MKSRNADYSLTKIAEKFKPSDRDCDGTCANIKHQVEGEKWDSSLCATTMAPMLLARLCALFNGLKIEVTGQEGYKTTWNVVLEHPATGHIVTFYDYKGGSSFGSDVYGDAAPKPFLRDLKALIEVLKNDRCPHPYDDCAVGEQA